MTMTFDEAYQIVVKDLEKHPERYAVGDFGADFLEVNKVGYDLGDKFLMDVGYSEKSGIEVVADIAYTIDKKTGKIADDSYMTYFDGIGTKYPKVELSNAITKHRLPS